MRGRRLLGGALLVGAVLAGGAAPATSQVTDSLSLTPDEGPIGTSVQITGTISCPGQAEGSDLLVRWVDPNAGPQTAAALGTTTLGAGGAFSTSADVPAEMGQLVIGGGGPTTVPVTPGTYEIVVQCTFSETTPNDVDAPFTVTESTTATSSTTTTTTAPTTSETTGATTPTTADTAPGFTPPATPPSGATAFTSPPAATAPGGAVTIDETGFGAGEQVPVVLYSTPVVLTTATADSQGRVHTTVTIPAGTAAGQHTLVLFGESQVKAATITVQAAPTLPRTGVDTWVLTLAGVAALLVGAQALGLSRRRQAS